MSAYPARKWAICSLLIAHACAMVLAVAYHGPFAFEISEGVSEAQAVLLGWWFAHGRCGGIWRLNGFGVGLVALWGTHGRTHAQVWAETVFFPYFEILTCVLLSAASFAVISRYYSKLGTVSNTPADRSFSLSSFFVLTSLIALWMAGHTISIENNFGAELFIQMLDGSYFVAVGLVTAWAALSTSGVIVRSFIAVVAIIGISLIFDFGDGAVSKIVGNLFPIIWLAGLILFGTFVVIRSCGYRLVPITPPDTLPPPSPEHSH